MKELGVSFLVVVMLIACVGPHTSNYEPSLSLKIEIEEKLLESAITSLRNAFEPAKTVFVYTPSGSIGTGLEAGLLQLGYGVSRNVRRDTAELNYVVQWFDQETLHLGLKVGDFWRTDRLFRFGPDGELLPKNAYATTKLPPSLKHHGSTEMFRELDGKDVVVVEDLTECQKVSFERGSLKGNIERLLENCGMRLGHWNIGREGFIEDWTVQQPYEIVLVDGLESLLGLIDHRYLLVGRVRPQTQTVDFFERKTLNKATL